MKMNRKAAAFITAGLMAMSLCVPASMTAYAGTITIGNVENDTVERQYKAYPIITGTFANDGKTLTNPQWGEGIDSAKLIAALKTNASTLGITLGETPTIEDVVTALGGMTDAKKIEKLAKILDDIAIIPATASAIELEENAAGNYATGNITNGWYLIKDGSTLTDNDVQSANLLQLTKVDGDEVINPKYSLPTLDKEITAPNPKDEGKANAVNIGDIVSYKLTSDMPDMTGYEKYYYVMNDTLSKGLTFKADSVVVKIGETTLTAAKDYEVQIQTAAAPYTFQIVFKDFVNRTEAKNTPITVTYDAVLNENADTSTAGNLNTANLTYSNNPNKHYEGTPPTSDEPGDGEPTGETPNRQTKTYAANVELLKVDEDGNKLAGAKFKIEGEGDKIILVNGTAYEPDDNGTYYMLNTGGYTDTAPTEETEAKYETNEDGSYKKFKKVEGVTATTDKTKICTEAYVDANGILVFNGLGAGKYKITELIAPDGYNKLEQPIEFTLTDGDHTFANGPAWTVSGGVATMNEDKVTVNLSIKNKAGSTLPSTGGIGTKLFFVFGAAMAIGSGIYLVTKKRMTGIEE